MSPESARPNENDAIHRVVQHYLDGAVSGRSDDMRAAFHDDATIFGHFGADLLAGPIELLFAWHDGNGPATALRARLARVDVVGTVASVRLEIDDWTGHRFTDLLTLLRLDGTWRIVSKVFHLHL